MAFGRVGICGYASMRQIQLNDNFSNSTYPVLTTAQNDEKIHIFYPDSLVFLCIRVYYSCKHISKGVKENTCINPPPPPPPTFGVGAPLSDNSSIRHWDILKYCEKG